MAYRSDRQRVEALLLPQFLLGVLLAGVNDPDHPDAIKAKGHLLAASREAFADLNEKKQRQIVNRAHRAHLEVMAPYEKQGARVDKIGLIVYFILKSITDCDFLMIHADSEMQKGVDLMLDALMPSAEIEPLLDSARKQSRKALEHLQRLGYYDRVPFSA